MIGYGLQEMLNKAFYAEQNGKTPMRVSVVGICLNIALSFVFVRGFKTGIAGLPAAASVASVFMSLTLAVLLSRRYRIFDADFLKNSLKYVVAGIVMSLTIWAMSLTTYPDSFIGRVADLILPSAVGFVLYLVVAFALKTNEIKTVSKIFSKRSVSNE